ncbi:MAG: hypothetical protein GWP10_06335 [Nitrospiraceae bacterium]|nr:hypothetical protein [Nitrospiraceae bacterium]
MQSRVMRIMRILRMIIGCESMTTQEHRIECDFTHSKETKGTHQYKEDGDDVKIGTIYLKKHALKDGVPDQIKVTVEW